MHQLLMLWKDLMKDPLPKTKVKKRRKGIILKHPTLKRTLNGEDHKGNTTTIMHIELAPPVPVVTLAPPVDQDQDQDLDQDHQEDAVDVTVVLDQDIQCATTVEEEDMEEENTSKEELPIPIPVLDMDILPEHLQALTQPRAVITRLSGTNINITSMDLTDTDGKIKVPHLVLHPHLLHPAQAHPLPAHPAVMEDIEVTTTHQLAMEDTDMATDMDMEDTEAMDALADTEDTVMVTVMDTNMDTSMHTSITNTANTARNITSMLISTDTDTVTEAMEVMDTVVPAIIEVVLSQDTEATCTTTTRKAITASIAKTQDALCADHQEETEAAEEAPAGDSLDEFFKLRVN